MMHGQTQIKLTFMTVLVNNTTIVRVVVVVILVTMALEM